MMFHEDKPACECTRCLLGRAAAQVAALTAERRGIVIQEAGR